MDVVSDSPFPSMLLFLRIDNCSRRRCGISFFQIVGRKRCFVRVHANLLHFTLSEQNLCTYKSRSRGYNHPTLPSTDQQFLLFDGIRGAGTFCLPLLDHAHFLSFQGLSRFEPG